MAKQKHTQASPAAPVEIVLPDNAVKDMAPVMTGHFTHSISALGDTQELTPAALSRSDMFPCTKKRSFGRHMVVSVGT